VKIKYDVSEINPEDSAGGALEDPRPGVYNCVIKEINHGFSKGEDGKPDKSRARLEVVFQVQDDPYKGSQVEAGPVPACSRDLWEEAQGRL
jgi:hypothetical protein